MHPVERKVIATYSLCDNPSCCPEIQFFEDGGACFVEKTTKQVLVTLSKEMVGGVAKALASQGRSGDGK